MRTITTNVFTYNELNDAAKAKARDWYREASAHETYYAEAVIEDAATIAALLGIDFKQVPVRTVGGKTHYESAVSWSGFSSQGDGASFEGGYAYRADCLAAVVSHAPEDKKLHALARVLQDNGNGLAATITRRGRYCHPGTMGAEVTTADGGAVLLETSQALLSAFRGFADWIYAQLESEHDYFNEDAMVAESIVRNEYEFTETGKREG